MSHVYVILIVLISFVIFNGNSLVDVLDYLSGMFGLNGEPTWNTETIYYLKSYGVLFLIGIIAATPAVSLIIKKLTMNKKTKRIINTLHPIVIVVLLLVITGYLVDGSFNPFLYFRF